MSTKNALVCSLGVTVVSGVLLTIARGIPTVEQLIVGCAGMFVVSFVVLRFVAGKFE